MTALSLTSPAALVEPDAACAHCGTLLAGARGRSDAGASRYCCIGCAGAHALIQQLGLSTYYDRRVLDPTLRPPRPEDEGIDMAAYAHDRGDGTSSLEVIVDSLQCAACVWLIESVLARLPGMREGRVNMTTRRLRLAWDGPTEGWRTPVEAIERLGYRLVPLDSRRLKSMQDRQGAALMRALAVAGFAAGNIMLLSIGVWAGHAQGIGVATVGLLHGVSALIALPAVAYAGQPFFRSALAALRQGRTNMDVPISIGVVLVTAMSLHQTLVGGAHAFFDSATMLLFFLLIGRVLDHRARGAARAVMDQLLGLRVTAVRIVQADGQVATIPGDRVRVGDRVLVAAGERIGVDGRVTEGVSSLDTSLVTGESQPRRVAPGGTVHAGMINLGAPFTCIATATGEATLLAEIVRLMEAAESRRSRFVALADRVARRYAPVVHLTALATFLGWLLIGEADWQMALSAAVAVLIITCPCALALAVPVVQVLASARLLKQGILLKSATALERLEQVDTVVFDKTGTLTVGRPALRDPAGHDPDALALAAGIARSSRHPLARALVAAAPAAPALPGVTETAGAGLSITTSVGEIRLGNAAFCGVGLRESPDSGSELWLTRPDRPPVRFAFDDDVRSDARAVVSALSRRGLGVRLLSGDRAPAVAAMAAKLGIADWRAAANPAEKVAQLAAVAAEGGRVLMVGDGLNDAPALAAALVSMSPATGADIAQNAADLVFQGDRLEAVTTALDVARSAQALARQNLGLAILYNLLAVPLAMAGYVTPLVAAAAMSASSLLVIANSFRLTRRRIAWIS